MKVLQTISFREVLKRVRVGKFLVLFLAEITYLCLVDFYLVVLIAEETQKVFTECLESIISLREVFKGHGIVTQE